jgi:hypothetical protein
VSSIHLQFTGVQSKFKTENIENNNLAKFEIGKAILPTPMEFSTDHKGKNAAQVDFCFARFQCRLRDGPACVRNSQNRRVLVVMYPVFLKFAKPVCILKYSSWMEKDLKHSCLLKSR